jgi:FkbH-like protein
LHDFRPTSALFAFDAHHLTQTIDPAMDEVGAEAARAEVASEIGAAWKLARDAFQCSLIQQTAMPVFPALMGNNEHRLPGSRHRMVNRLNVALRGMADEFGVDVLAIDDWVAATGLPRWHDPVLWHRAKQEISPAAAPLYGDLVARVVAARQGRSAKCLVLDLDNVLWGGVVGDDGVDGIVLGQGSALGEAYVGFQSYAHALAKRGVILAVCSKNDEANALAPFDRHPDMVMARGDIAAFVANWRDKAQNIRAIAQELNIGLDALVFVDDNPFERDLVRHELPMVAVPEIPADPARFASCLADAGYFEGLAVTDEDRARTGQYQANRERAAQAAEAADLSSYLRGLEMKLVAKRFDRVGLQRIVQLINKTNQFNLTTRRYTERDVLAVMNDATCFGLQLRLIDRFGDNGVIAIVIGRVTHPTEVRLDTWLMSCRVLGRRVEEATLNLVAAESRRLGAVTLIGEYAPTAKNGLVTHHYRNLGFEQLENDRDGRTLWSLDLASFTPYDTAIAVVET